MSEANAKGLNEEIVVVAYLLTFMISRYQVSTKTKAMKDQKIITKTR